MAAAIQRSVEVARTVSGNSPWKIDYPEAAGQTFKKGAFLALNSAGFVVECGADPARILGIADADGRNYTTAGDLPDCSVMIACDDTIFVANLVAAQASARTDVGGRYGIVKNASSPNNWQVDKADGAVPGGTLANAKVIVTNLDPRDGIGDTGAKVEFIIMSAASILAGTSPFV